MQRRAFLAAAAAACLPGCAREHHEEREPLFLGDSITSAWPLGNAQRAGFPGKTSAELAELAPLVLAGAAPIAFVHVLAGTNDDLAQPFLSIRNLRRMVWAARARGLAAVVGTIPPISATARPTGFAAKAPLVEAFNVALRDAMAVDQVKLADYYQALLGHEDELYDGVHPALAAYARMDAELERALRRA